MGVEHSIPLPEICQRYKKLYSGLISDCLDRVGLWNQFMDRSIMPLKDHTIIAGPAFTVNGRPERSLDKSIRLGPRVVDELKPLDIAVMQTNGDTQTGHWGELLSNGALARGAGGAVIDGGIRDTGFILELDFPVFYKFRCPGDALGRWNVTDIQIPITAGNVRVRPGDFIFGDPDGVVVIPQELTETILLAAEKALEEENEIRQRIRKGEKLAELYLKYEHF